MANRSFIERKWKGASLFGVFTASVFAMQAASASAFEIAVDEGLPWIPLEQVQKDNAEPKFPSLRTGPVSALLGLVQEQDNPEVNSAELESGMQLLVKPWGILVDAKLEAQRQAFLDIDAMINRREFTKAQEAMLEITDYPLFPYLEGALLENNIRMANEAVITEFLAEHGGLPVARSLRTNWLQLLRGNNDAERFLRDYQPQSSLVLQCQALRYRYRQLETQSLDEQSLFWQDVTRFWTHGESLPSACDSLFRIWADAGYRTEEVVWQRIQMAQNAQQNSLVRYLSRFLSEEKQDLLSLQRRVRANARVIQRFHEFSEQHELIQSMVLDALSRLRWNDHWGTINAWEHYQTIHSFSAAQTQAMNADIAVTLALRGEPEAIEWFQRLPIAAMSNSVRQWYLASLLQQKRFDLINEFVLALPSAAQQEPQWLYWRGRALAELGLLEDSTELLVNAAQSRNYYGFMASARMSLPANLQNESTTLVVAKLREISLRGEAMRARELLHHGRLLDARREWNVLRARAPADEQVLIAVLASEWGWHDQAIFGLAGTSGVNDVMRRFPLAFAPLLLGQSESANIDPAWAFAIARRESSFQPDAVSPVGARGLMQVMPATADYINRRSPSSASSRGGRFRLDVPEDNVRMGTQYLAELHHRFDGNWLLATAAYNAGSNRVREWIPGEPMPADLWIELIPYQETRDYVKAVLAYQQIYAMLLGNNANVLRPLVRMQVSTSG
ncbi:soluble lytic murein transglycosylase-like protein [Idiomarina sp. A28L]|uniref:transglycosylase SLT domain-containing protein n=1 Tax=Idiomarina sp. A28L TaxID=1036674 RepID=UPI0002138D03|nr:transglycosylase SLT domain-containing protein [Idiomarina sp. A28L]EGN76038.1 soluble lytic murein transglycosylase-like protein [Idiomarina sp. A28L]